MNGINALDIWKSVAIFTGGAFLSGVGAWATMQQDAITPEDLDRLAPWNRDKAAVMLMIETNKNSLRNIELQMENIRLLAIENNRLISLLAQRQGIKSIRTNPPER